MTIGIKARYNGMPIFQVGCLKTYVDKRLEGFFIAGKQVLEKAVSYMLIPANSVLEARAIGVAKALAEPREGYVVVSAEGYNTHEWHGEPNTAEAARKSYETFVQTKEAH